MKQVCVILYFLLSCAVQGTAQRYDAEEYEFGVQIVGMPEKAMKDSTSVSFDQLNKPRMLEIQDRLRRLPINRCKTSILVVSLRIHADGATDEVYLRQATGNAKQDSLIARTIRQTPGAWQGVPPAMAEGRSLLTAAFSLPMIYERAHHTSSDPGASPAAYLSDRCKDADHFYNEGVRELSEQRLPRALRNFKSAHELNPYDLDCLYNLAVVYFKSEEPEKACDCLKKAASYGDARSEESVQRYCPEAK